MERSYLLHTIKDIRFSIAIPVRANTKIDFPRVLVGLESFGDAC